MPPSWPSIVNVVLNAEKQIIGSFAGDVEEAPPDGLPLRQRPGPCGQGPLRQSPSPPTGGYPLDQNVYQAVKGMTAAEATVREGGRRSSHGGGLP